MKNRNKIFSFSLFLEGIRQLRMIGILFAVIYALQVVLLLGLPVLSQMSQPDFDLQQVVTQAVNGFSVMPILYVSFTVLAPLLTLYMFKFLNKRNDSDFYHSLQQTRPCIYLSLLASIFAWITAITLFTCLLGIATTGIFSHFYSIMWADYLLFALGSLIASFAVAAAVGFAMSVTGTVFTNVVVSLFIIFLPRAIIFLGVVGITEAFPIMYLDNMNPILNTNINIVTGTFFGSVQSVFQGMQSTTIAILNPWSMLYTAFLAVVYIAVGCLLFTRRRSEVATQSAPNRILQNVYRITTTFIFCAFYIAAMFPSIYHGSFGIQDWISTIVIVVIALLIYFIYELITTKSFKKLLRAIPGLGILLICCAAFYGVLAITTKLEMNFTPAPEKIKSIAIVSGSLSKSDNIDFLTYALAASTEAEIKDPSIIRLVSERLKEQVSTLENDDTVSLENHYSSYDYIEKSEKRYSTTPIRITTNGGSKYRLLYLSTDETQSIMEAISNSEGYANAFKTLPPAVADTVTYYDESQGNKNCDAIILKLMAEDLKNVDFTSWYTYEGNNPVYTVQYVVASGIAKGKTLTVRLNEEFFPKTVQYLYDLNSDKKNENINKLKALLETYKSDANARQYEWRLSCNLTGKVLSGDKFTVGSDQLSAVEFFLANCSDKPRTVGDNDLIVTIFIDCMGKKMEVSYNNEEEVKENNQSAFAEFVLKDGLSLYELSQYVDIPSSIVYR